MAVVGGNKRNACLIRELNKSSIYLCLFWRGICLYLKIVIASAEELVIPDSRLRSLLRFTVKDKRRQLSGYTSGKAYQSFVPLLKEFLIDPRTSVKTFSKACRYKPVEVCKTNIIFCKKDQVIIVFVFPSRDDCLIESGTGRDIDFASDYRMDSVSLHLTVKRYCAVHYAVIGYGA